MSKRRVVVTGMGIVSPVGNDLATAWKNVVEGNSGIGPVTEFDASAYATRIAGEVRGFDPVDAFFDGTDMPEDERRAIAKDFKRMDPFIHYGIVAGTHAFRQSGLVITDENAGRVGVAAGAGIGGLHTIEGTALELAEKGPRKVSPFYVPSSIINMVAGNLSIYHGLKGPNIALVSACTTAAHNIGMAMRLIQYGDADAMLAGGAEFATTPTAMAGFCSAKAMSTRNDDPTHASRPWDTGRDGFLLSNGAGMLMLEEYEFAKARGATILAEIIGFGMSGDAYHITAPSGDGAELAMRNALHDAGLKAEDVQYVNAHGTSTPVGDMGEAKAIRSVFGEHATQKGKFAVSSTKSVTGHLLGAAGGVEAIFTILALRDGIIPPTMNLHDVDPEVAALGMDLVPNKAEKADLTVAISNSFGFGGTNGTLAFPPRLTIALAFTTRTPAGRRDLLAPAALFPARYPALLASAVTGTAQSRFDILFAGGDASLALDAQGALRDGNGEPVDGTFLDALDRAWAGRRRPRVDDGLPFHGGWVVYLGYELAAQVEPSLRLPASRGEVPVAFALRAPAAAIVDHVDGRTILVAEEGATHWLDTLEADLAMAMPDLSLAVPARVDEDAPERFLAGVRRIHEHLRAGDTFQVNLSRRWTARFDDAPAPAALMQALRRANPAPFAGLLQHAGWAIVSSSPERLVESRDGVLQTRPIAGTRPRVAGDDDAARIRELATHPKERAEHVMLIDLERNDLGRVCVPGSVRVDELMVVESYAHVHHIVSNVRGRAREGVTPGEVIAATFPGGTITGCPKVRCMQIIGDIEQEPRGAYTGALGYLDDSGDMDLNILIRTLTAEGRDVSLRAGAGIVTDSVPDRELDETRAKARGLLRIFGAA